MRIRVLFFGQLKDIVECSEDTLELPAGARVETVFRQLCVSVSETGRNGRQHRDSAESGVLGAGRRP